MFLDGYTRPESWQYSFVHSEIYFIFAIAGFFPQQPERLGVLPIKLRGGLGQPPETLHQVPRGSEGMEPVPK